MNKVYSTTVIKEPSRKQQYHNYLKHSVWKNKRRKFLKKECEVCGNERYLQLHHLSYDKAYQLPRKEAKTLCSRCHSLFHKYYGVKKDMRADFKKFEQNYKSIISSEKEAEAQEGFIRSL